MSSDSFPAGEAPSDGEWKLPRGPHGIPREVVVDHQRQRLLAGAATALAAHGYAELSVEHIISEAGVSRTTFYEQFDNKRECVLTAHEQAFDRLTGELIRACAGQSDWPTKVVAAIATAVVFAYRAPEQAQLLVLDCLAADPVLVERVLASQDFLVGLLRNGREQSPEAAALPELTERALIGATTSLIGQRLLCDEVDQLPALAPQLIQLIVIPYVGHKEAARLAKIALPPPGFAPWPGLSGEYQPSWRRKSA
jgi:AcrR family transcriptional regulator